MSFMINCKRIVGAIEGSSNPAKGGYKEGKFPVDKLAKVYDADRLVQALKVLHSGKVIKPVLKWADL
ncbi:uncharacterized protein N7496_010677 [Penicillium cataractarum]|uniref:Uncharacterized protein n=1 Tax=Penicillium cataractarum TaxID=2100454 RepID=A0A9W9RTF9_9EURO|nr:uncharacterized protein N7496_010677 [Penicillium cataractarum]KAJ5364964.1 hypothetical protein N7496_010677 [Penicillium cataractarum]